MSGAESLLVDVLRSIQDNLGVTILYGRASPSILGSISLSSLNLETPDERKLLRAGRFSVGFSLFHAVASIFGRGNPAGSLDRVTLRNAEMVLDLQKDADLLKTLRAALQSKESTRPGRERIRPLGISVRRVRMVVRDPAQGAAWSADIRSMDLTISEREILVALNGSLSGTFGKPGGTRERYTVPIRLKGSMNREFTTARFSVSVAGKSGLGSLESQNFAILLKDGLLEARRVRDRVPIDLYVKYDTKTGFLEAETHFESLSLSRLLYPAGQNRKTLGPWFRGPFTGYASIRNKGSWEDARLELNLRGSLPKEVLGNDVGFRLVAEGSPRRVVVDTLDIESPGGAVRVSGNFQPDGASVDLKASVDYRMMDGELPVSALINIVGEGREIFLHSEKAEIAGVEFRDFAVFVTQNPGSYDFRGGMTLPVLPSGNASEAFSGREEAGSPKRTVDWEGSLSTGKVAFLEGALEIDPYELAALGPLLAVLVEPPAANFLESLSVGGRLTVTSDFSKYSYAASDLRISSTRKSGKSDFMVLNLAGTADSLTVSRFSASLGENPMEGSLEVRFGGKGNAAFKTEFRVREIPYFLEGEYEASRLFITGAYGLFIAASRSEAGINGIVKFSALPLSLEDGMLLLTTEISGGMRSTADWSAQVTLLDLKPEGGLRGRVPMVRLSGSADPTGLRFPEVRVADSRSSLEGSVGVGWDTGDFRKPIEIRAELSRGTEESIRLSGVLDDGKISGKAELSSLSVSRFFGEAVSGSLSGSLFASGAVEDPRADFALVLDKGRLGPANFSLSAEGGLDRRGLTILDASGRYGKHQAQDVRGSLDFGNGRVSVQGGYSGSLGEETARFRFAAEGRLAPEDPGPEDSPVMSRLFEEMVIRGQVENFSMGKKSAPYWPFRVEKNGMRMEFQGGTASEVTLQFLEDGSFLARAVSPFPLSFLAVGKVSERQIAMDLSDIRMEMPVLWALIPLPDVQALSGIVTGALSVRGSASDPEIYGSLSFQDTTLTVPSYVNAPIGPITSPLEANGRTVTLIQPVIDIGSNTKASVSLSFEMSQWVPTNFTLRARSLESTQIPLKTRFLGMTVDGTAEADIYLTAQENLLTLTGDLTIPRADIVVDPSIIQTASQEGSAPKTNTKIDLGIQMGKGVTVYFPSKEFPVILGQADPSSRLSVWYDDREQSFALKGNAVLRGGNLFYIQRNFYLKSGKLVFNENQYSFDPRVTLEAELRTRYEDQSIRIILRAENQSLLSLQPTLESVPSLSQTEIAALLGSDLIAADEGTEVNIRRTLIASTDIIPQLNFVSVFQRNTQRLLGLDIFYLRTEIVQRWLMDVANLDAQIDQTATLADYLDNTSVYFGKYIRDDVFLHGSLQLEQRRPLVNKSSLRLDSEIGFELATPFFLFDWSVALLHPEDLFISDNSFSFTWRLSY